MEVCAGHCGLQASVSVLNAFSVETTEDSLVVMFGACRGGRGCTSGDEENSGGECNGGRGQAIVVEESSNGGSNGGNTGGGEGNMIFRSGGGS